MREIPLHWGFSGREMVSRGPTPNLQPSNCNHTQPNFNPIPQPATRNPHPYNLHCDEFLLRIFTIFHLSRQI